jgi:signal transduction histidine kinase
MQLPSRSDERTVTFLEREGEPVAVLVHDPALTSDPVLAEAVGAAARLTGSNAQLQADLRAQVRELATSRRRVVEVGDVQRSRLERRLDQAAALHLVEMRAAVAQALQVASPAVADALVLVEQELDQTVIELRQLAHGIHPHALTESGLAPALAELAASAPITVSVAATGERFTPAVEVAAYFVCAEALANVAKYAQTDAALVGIRQHNGRLVVSVADDGVGGADSTRGSGLRGLADRVEALGGLLTVSSPTSGGTAVLAEIPLDGAS